VTGPDPDPDPTTVPDQNLEPAPGQDPDADPTPPRAPRPTGPVQYKGADLEAERGPGLGCFRFQLIVLVIFIVLAPLSALWHWPEAISAILLFVVVGLLLTTGQTIIFLLRLVAADRRSRRRPMASGSKTVGELEDEGERPAGGSPGDRTDERTGPDDASAGGQGPVESSRDRIEE
jgi:hypothetical protein